MNGFARALSTLGLVVLILLTLAGQASAAPYAHGTCAPETGTSTYTVSGVGAGVNLHDLNAKLVVTGGPGTWNGGESWSGPETLWQSGVDLVSTDGPPTGVVSCAGASKAFDYDIRYQPRPLVAWGPNDDFSGTLEGPAASSSFGFSVKEGAYYRAYVAVSGGPLAVEVNGNAQVVDPPGSNWVELGYLTPGPHDIEVKGAGAGAVGYSILFFELNATISDLANTAHYVRPGATIPIGFTLSGDARVQRRAVRDSDGRVVQRLDAGTPLGPGHQELMWTATDDAGAPLPDGGYSLYLTPQNSFPYPPEFETEVVVDSQPPTFSFFLPLRPIEPWLVPLDVSVLDVFDDVASLTVDNGPPITIRKDRLSYLPAGGWRSGEHRATVVATDPAGNVGSQTMTFTIPPRPPAVVPYVRPHCATPAIRTAVRKSKPLNATLRAVGRMPRGDLFRHFRIAQRECADVTGDFSPELVVLLREKSGPRTVLAVFGYNGRTWRLAFQDAKHRIDRFTPRLSHYLTESVHGGQRIRVYWTGHGFALMRL
jgi:hypothetical protein